ncbi:ABC transporter substrate-binding protein [Robertmurraya massiliosenegalensis]|uniref:ABC transporter substrate-binding protein n=1 Tax=Robertmurraya massiliosenegalensis TaxID=1287657 RepID=UPI0002FD817F|nr:ABC transporter substrate-binding protein [Robertmurraya massiliosenegalensis]
MKKYIIASFIVLMSLVGCSNSQSDGGLEEISIMLDWYPNAVHSAIYMAEEKGYFADEGLKVKVEMPADTNDPLKLAATGKVDLAISYQTQLLMSRAEDIPVVSIAAFVRHSLDGIMYLKDSNIQSPKDLVGKNVGYPSSSVSEAILKTMVEHDGGDASEVKLTDVGWDLMPSLATKNVDALVGAYVNHELVLLEKEGYDVDMFPLTEYGVPENYELILVTGESTLEKKEDAFSKFWKALAKGQEDVQHNPSEGLEVLFNNENESFPLDREVETESLNILLPLMDDGTVPFGYQEDDVWQEVANWLYETGVLKEKVDPSHAFTNIVSE